MVGLGCGGGQAGVRPGAPCAAAQRPPAVHALHTLPCLSLGWELKSITPLPSGADRHAEEVLAQYAVEEKEGPAWIKAHNNQPGDGQALPSR